jgi:RNA polymerase sigma-70 factor (ECF subfamily)
MKWKLLYSKLTIVTTPSLSKLEAAFNDCAADIAVLHARCAEAAPNYGVSFEAFKIVIRVAVEKYLFPKAEADAPSALEIRDFINELQVSDIFLALACAQGNEHAWWEFDQGFRGYLERAARHFATADTGADEVLDTVYVELYGTRVVNDVRQSKFATYTGRGTLRGWLRTVVWHAAIDLHRAARDEISIDEWTEGGGEAHDRPGQRAESGGEETLMVERLTRERYGAMTVAALDAAFAALDDHEKLLLLLYHVEEMKLREIARLVEAPDSPLRSWFQRQSKQREAKPESRVHESTVMRWLEKVYGKVLEGFRRELKSEANLSAAEVELCLKLATEDLATEDVRRHLINVAEKKLSKEQPLEPSTDVRKN